MSALIGTTLRSSVKMSAPFALVLGVGSDLTESGSPGREQTDKQHSGSTQNNGLLKGSPKVQALLPT